ncbi:MAG TPA: nickel-type superoxide dismutase maturation protease [Candidatus Dormibacteraeota bacterium]|nr:nickel-type superoxide dismutase maturation protease [Candidatus Dormibacteraeota bacterium]
MGPNRPGGPHPLHHFHRAKSSYYDESQILKSVYPLRVSGDSMEPGLRDGALVIAHPVDSRTYLRVGDVVVARRPDRPDLDIIKRIHAIDAAGQVFLTGDNLSRSTESVDFGWVPRDHIRALVRWRYWPLPPRRV